MRTRRSSSWLAATALAVALGAACTGNLGSDDGGPPGSGTGTGTGTGAGAGSGAGPGGGQGGSGSHVSPPPVQAPPAPFESLSPGVYGTKIKNLLVGAPLTDEEYKALTADPTQLASLVDTWAAEPAWHDRLLIFFKQAFQQTQVLASDYVDVVDGDDIVQTVSGQTPVMRVLEEMFPRTALAVIDEGRPFTEVVTSSDYMVTPPLLAILGYIDMTPRDDQNKPQTTGWWKLQQDPMFSVTLAPSPTIVETDSLDDASNNFMKFSDSLPGTSTCPNPKTVTGGGAIDTAFQLLFGHRPGCKTNVATVFTDADWNAWRKVTIRAPNEGEAMTEFWDLDTLRTAKEVVFQTPRVGFMTTPAFLANWPTNTSNQARVTTNQTVIVALGHAFDDRGVTVQVTSTSGDAQHAQPGTACYACHQTLDPMRDFFRQSYTYNYNLRGTDKNNDAIPTTATFTVDGSAPVSGVGIGAMAKAIAAHPRFAVAWAQKLCRFANSWSCDENDPEFRRVAKAFSDSNFNFKTLVHEMMSSPLVSYAQSTQSTIAAGIYASIDRRDSLCASLSNRLGLPDLCNLFGTQAKPTQASVLTTAVPGDAYARGAEEPMMPTDPNLFFVSATKNLCEGLSNQLVDGNPAPSRYVSTSADTLSAALDDFVATVMGVPPSDPRSAKLRSVLEKHYQAALAKADLVDTKGKPTKSTPTLALRSAFMLACSSPLTVASGL